MNILRLPPTIALGLILLSQNIYAEEVEQDTAWFVGGGASYTSFVGVRSQDDFNDEGFDFHFGKQIIGNAKLMLGFQRFKNSNRNFFECFTTGWCQAFEQSDNLSSFYLKYKPHFEISEHFLIFAEAGVHNYIQRSSFSRLVFTDMTRNTLIESASSDSNSSNSKFGYSVGFGVVYRFGQHDLSLGFASYSLNKNEDFINAREPIEAVRSLSLQYDYHIDI